MTICIAAACRHENEPRIVVVADRMLSSDEVSGEIAFKWDELLPNGLLALYSGTPSEALDLIYSYRLGLNRAKMTVEELPDELRRILVLRKQYITDTTVALNLGMPMQHFVDLGGRFDSETGAALLDEIYKARIDAELIVTGFLPDTMREILYPVIAKVIDKGVSVNENFICIGAGTVPAEQVLYRREQRAYLNLDMTIYNLFEAKKMAEIARSVGQETIMAVMKPRPNDNAGFQFFGIGHETLFWLLQRYLEYGPKPMFGLNIPTELRTWDND